MRNKTSVLVVDDDPAILQIYSEFLRAEGYEVWEAATGLEGLQMTRQRRPDLVLLDVRLPDLSGMEVCRQLKADVALQDVFVVLLSGAATGAADKVDGLDTGADDYLTKPVAPAEFLARVRTIVRLRNTTAALRASEQRYRELVEIMPDAVVRIDPRGRLLAVNPQAVAMFGYSSQEELLHKSAFDLAQPKDHVRLQADITTVLETGSVRDVEYRMVRKDGHGFPAELRSAVATHANGQAAGLVVVVRDITERKQAEAELRSRQEHLQLGLEAARMVTWDYDIVLGSIRYSDNLPDFVGGRAIQPYCSLESVLLQMHPDDRDSVRQGLKRAEAPGAVFEEEYRAKMVDGSYRWIFAKGRAVRDEAGAATRIHGISMDVTDRKRADEKVAMLAHAVESTDELICITDLQNRLTFANRAFLSAYGYAAGELMGRTPDFLHSAKNPPGLWGQVFEQTLQGGWQGELLNCRRDGTEFPIALSTSQVKNAEGKTIGLIGVARDISERQRAEKQTGAFSQLGHRLSAAAVPEQAAQIIMDIASELFGWDAGYVHLYSESDDELIPVLTVDTVGGRRSPVQPASFTLDPSPLMRLIMKEGAQLINREHKAPLSLPLVPFGDTTRLSASMMYVPIRSGSSIIGILSVQSYTPRAYSEDDLQLLQALADHCGDALLRMKGREALREAEAKYRSIVENATEGIFQTTPDGRFRSANPALARMLGYQTPAELVASVTDLDRQSYVKPERRQELKRLLATQGSVRGFEFEHYRRDGSIIWVSVNAHAVCDARGGAVLYYEGTIQDITQRRWVESLLRRQRDFGIFLSSTDDLEAAAARLLKLALDNEGLDCGAVYLVHSETEALELTAQQGLSGSFAKRAWRVAADSLPDRLAGARQATSQEQVQPMAVIVQELKRESLLALEAIPIQHSGQVVAVLNVGSLVHREIPRKTRHVIEALAAQAGGAIARIRAEQSLRTSRQVLEKTIHSLRSAIFIVDAPATTIQECNSAATRMFGHSREEMIGQSPALLHLNETKREEFRRHLDAAVKEKGLLSDFEFEMKRKDGASFPAELTLVPIRNQAGQSVAWVGVVRDVTERKKTEEGLRQLSRHVIEAQEAERQRVARELHDSVNQVIASAKMRLRKVESCLAMNPMARELLARCDELLVQALDENRRIAHGLRPADLDALGLADACRNFCRQFQARTNLVVKTRFARLARRCPPAMELNLFRIVQEGLNNVEKYAHAKTVRLQIASQRGGLMLRIQDDGGGFDPRAAKPVKRKGEGTGLTNMQERAAILGGTCEVASVPNKGTTITVRVPFPTQ